MTDVRNLPVVNVPSCSHQTHSAHYSAVDAANYTPNNGSYYRGKLPVMLPGAIIGVICLIAALIFLVWVSATPSQAIGVLLLARPLTVQAKVSFSACLFCSCSLYVVDGGRVGGLRRAGFGLQGPASLKSELVSGGLPLWEGAWIVQANNVLSLLQESSQRQACHQLDHPLADSWRRGCGYLGPHRQHQEHQSSD